MLEKTVVVFDDLGFLDVLGKLVAFWESGEDAGELFGIDGDITDGSWSGIHGFFDNLEWAGLLEGDGVADVAEIGSDVDFLAVDKDVAVVDKLTGSGAGAGEAHAIDEVVKAGFKNAEEGKTGNGWFLLSNQEEAAELTFVDAVKGAELLLLKELGSVFGRFSLAILTVLAWAISTLFEFVTGLKNRET